MRQQLVGMFYFAVPLIGLYQIWPGCIYNFWLLGLYSLAIGLYVAYNNYTTSKTVENSLNFVPSGECLEFLASEISKCGMQPKDINLRYAYTDAGVALALFNTVIIDPVSWKSFEGDPTFLKCKDVIENQVMVNASEARKTLQFKINSAICSSAQKFIFRHELGHVFYNYAYKRILVNGIIGVATAIFGIATVLAVIGSFGGLVAALLGIVVAALVDIIATYSSNLFFKAREEKKADMFAVMFSSKEEVKEAANFFKQHEKAMEEYKGSLDSFLGIKIPSILATGHMDGVMRSKYLNTLSRSL